MTLAEKLQEAGQQKPGAHLPKHLLAASEGQAGASVRPVVSMPAPWTSRTLSWGDSVNLPASPRPLPSHALWHDVHARPLSLGLNLEQSHPALVSLEYIPGPSLSLGLPGSACLVPLPGICCLCPPALGREVLAAHLLCPSPVELSTASCQVSN